MDSDSPAMELGDAEIVFNHPELGHVRLRTRVTSSRGLGEIIWSTLGAANSLDEVVIHWMDLPSVLPADSLDDGVSTWSGRWSATGGGWALTLDSRPDYVAVAAAAAGHPVHVVTHVASLRRQDGSTFTPAEAEDALEAWQSTFSFALGRWVPPTLAVGFSDGKRAWELWGAWRSDEFSVRYAWWDTHRGDDLRLFAREYLNAWADATRHDKVRYVAHHIIESDESAMTLEARIMLASAGVEYLSWVKYVLDGGRSRSEHKKRLAADKLGEMLDEATVPKQVPPELATLASLTSADGAQLNGPEAIAWVRNRLVHPKDMGEPYRLDGLLLEAWQLLMHYSELLLLFDLPPAPASPPPTASTRSPPPPAWPHPSPGCTR
jgi:hypothetical protein